MKTKGLGAVAMVALMAVALSACQDGVQTVYPEKDRGASAPRMSNEKRETIFGPEGLFSTGKKQGEAGDGVGIGVNSFLWRASLDTLGFMPIANADPFGGTIITDWYQMPESQAERFKVNVFILDRALRADGVKVSVFKQARDGAGQWVDIKVEPKVATDLENTILTRARELRTVSNQ